MEKEGRVPVSPRAALAAEFAAQGDDSRVAYPQERVMSHVAMFTPYGSLPRPTVPRKTPATAERTRWPLAPERRSGPYQSRRRRGHHPPGRGWPKGRRRRMSGVGIHAHDSSMEAIPLYHCFHSRPLLQVCTLSSCPTFFWQRWRLPSAAIFSFTQRAVLGGPFPSAAPPRRAARRGGRPPRCRGTLGGPSLDDLIRPSDGGIVRPEGLSRLDALQGRQESHGAR